MIVTTNILRKKILSNLPPNIAKKDISLIENAFSFAEEAHQGQKRETGEMFINHPLRVALEISKMKMDTDSIVAAILHDTVEDCNISLADIKSQFNEEVASLVQGLTKINTIKYREEKKLEEKENYRNIILAMAKDLRVILIKLADRLDNMRTLWALPEEKRKENSLETLEILAPLAYRLGISDIGAQLEDLSFPYIYPQEYKTTRRITGKRREELESYLKGLVPYLRKELKRHNLHPQKIKFRTKHIYSIWRKLKKEEMDISHIYDLVAMRVIMPTIDECYEALGIIHQLWKPVPGRFKDYIAMPKPNGYQSLHTTVFAQNGRIVEIQLRTEKMDEEAEWGIAAHWLYSSQKGSAQYIQKKTSAHSKKLYWLEQLHDWQKKFYDSKEFMNALKIDFFKDRIFTITPKGKIIDLPDGATPIDFAYQIHTEIGNQAREAKVNGKTVPLDYQLKSGEVVEIITQKGKLPSPSWLEFVKMIETKRKIQDVLRKKGKI